MLKIKLARTLWHNTFRAKITDENDAYIASLRIIPAIPLDRADVPPDAPEVQPYIIVLVEDAPGFTIGNIVEYEELISSVLLAELEQHKLTALFCQFYYPSPIEFLDQSNTPH